MRKSVKNVDVTRPPTTTVARGFCISEPVPFESAKILSVHRWDSDSRVCVVYHFGDGAAWQGTIPPGRWRVLLDSAGPRWQGPGSQISRQLISEGALSLALSAKQMVVLEREEK